MPSESPPSSISLFDSANATSPAVDTFTVWGALLLNGVYMTEWLDISVSILLWMTISYAVIYLGAAMVALITMRKHPYVFLVCIPMIVMCVLGPATVGCISSMSLGFALSASNKYISPWHCMILGVTQSVVVVGISFSRLLGTL